MRINPPKGFFKLLTVVILILVFTDSKGQLCTVNGGEITTASANILCRQEGSSNLFEINLANSSGPTSRWLITNQNNVVLHILNQLPLDLSILTEGLYKIYHVSYNDIGLGIVVGANTNEFIGCFDLSNSITLVVDEVNGGVLSDINGSDRVSICTDLEDLIVIKLNLSGHLGLNRMFLLTDDQGNIEQLQKESTFSLSYDVDATKYIYNVSYASIENLFVGSNIADLIGCFQLSNSYQLILEDSGTEAGTIGTNSNLTICSGDGQSDIIELQLEGNNNGINWFVVTDFEGFILKLTTTNTIDLEGITSPSISIKNIQYTAELAGLEVGQNINNIEECFDQSNTINITNTYINGGNLTGTDGKKDFFFCSNDNIPNNVNITVENSFGGKVLVVTDIFGDITQIINSNLVSFPENSNFTRYIFNISYSENNFGPLVGQNISTLTGCYDLSNRITVVLSNGIPNAGVISTEDNTFLCTGDNIPDIIDIEITSSGDNNSVWVFTDLNDNILDFPGVPPFDFTDSIGGDLIIRYIDFTGIENLRLGGNLSELEGCFDLSNPLLIQKTGVNAGTIRFDNEDFTIIECISERTSINLNIITENVVGDIQHFIVTNEENTILDIIDDPILDLSAMSNNNFQVNYISMLEGVTGLEPGNSLDNIAGCFDLSNRLTINLQSTTTTPSTIFTNSATFLCLNDGVSDVVEIGVDPGVGPSTSWVVTDEFGEILQIKPNSNFDFSQIAGDNNVIYNIKHDSGVEGIRLGSFLADLEGCYSISNPINISKGNNSGGNLSLDDSNSKIICLNDGSNTIVKVEVSNAFGQSSRFIVTDLSGNIQMISANPEINFSGLGRGNSYIYNASFTSGIQGIGITENINNIKGCIDFSNPVTIRREFLDGGFIATTANETQVEICAGEGKVDLINVILEENQSDNNRYIITDENGMIVSLPSSSNISFETGPTGNYYIYNLAYASNVDNIELGVNLDELNGCYSISNAITLSKSSVVGGELSIRGEGNFFEACISTGDIQAVTLNIENNSGNSIFVETTNQGVIQKIFQDPIINLNNVSPGQCRIYNISYFDIEGLEIENNINNLNGCYAISNHVLINKNEPIGGVLTDSEGKTELNLCVGDANSQLINVILTENIGQNSSWVLTDINNIILSTNVGPPFNLEPNEMNSLKLFNISFESGLIGLEKGKRLNQLIGCYSLSNPITVFKDNVEAYSLLVTDKFKTERTICVDDNDADIIELSSVGDAVGDQIRYIVTDEAGKIQALSQSPELDFTQYTEGISFIYQISYLNGLAGLNIDNNINGLQGCYALSKSVKIIRVGGAECLTPTIEIDDKTIKVDLFPNPASDFINIRFEGLESTIDADFSIIDLTGNRLYTTHKRIYNNGSTKLNINDLPTGIYFIELSIDHNQGVIKFLKL
jgi:hypothetical protein